MKRVRRGVLFATKGQILQSNGGACACAPKRVGALALAPGHGHIHTQIPLLMCQTLTYIRGHKDTLYNVRKTGCRSHPAPRISQNTPEKVVA